MSDTNLPRIAREIRKNIIDMLVKAGSGHTAGALGLSDLLAALYFGDMLRYKPDKPYWEERDRLVLSCGHYAPGLYATLALAGFFEVSELSTLRKLGSRLQGHVVHQRSHGNESHGQLPGVENTGGPLGQGVSVAVGMALAAKMDNRNWRTVCLSSDGEQQEGQVWEAYMTAVKYKLGNLIFMMDSNEIQISGRVSDVLPLEPLRAKYEAFGFQVREIDGHNFEDIKSVFGWADLFPDRPKMIVVRTIPGKGVSFMENKYEWHGKPPTKEQGILALAELCKDKNI